MNFEQISSAYLGGIRWTPTFPSWIIQICYGARPENYRKIDFIEFSPPDSLNSGYTTNKYVADVIKPINSQRV